MNKKTKLAIPFAVLALTCGIAAGCAPKAHTHSYTEWAYNETQHWKECPDDHVKDDGSVADHVFVDGTCECGATQQTPPVTDVTITNGTTDTNGTVTLSKTTAKAGDSVTVTVAPGEGYQLKSLTVDGVNVFGAMTNNTYTFTVTKDTTVVAVFEKIASSSVNAQITGKKYGVTGNSIAQGTQVTLSATGREDVTTTVRDDGTILIPEIAGDNWKVKVNGYVAAEIVIPRDETYTTAIALEYDLMENLSISWGNQDLEDLSEQNDGKITHTGGYYWQWVSTKDAYDSVAFTATALTGGARQGVFVRFKGDSYSNDEYVLFGKENNDKIGRCDAADGLTGKNLFNSIWGKENLIAPAANDSYEITVVRSGCELYFFVDGEFKLKETLDSKYENLECYVGLYCGNASDISGARDFRIDEASEYLNLTVTDETATNAGGSVTLSATSVAVNTPVTVTLSPDTNYKIKSLTVNGVAVSLSELRNNQYTFNVVKKDTVVAAEFEEAQTVESVVLTVTAASGFTADGTQITLEQLGEKWTGTVQDGTVTFGGAENPVALGDLNVTADFGGYQIKLGTVNITLPAEGTTATAEVTLGFTGTGIEYDGAVSSANPATGELTYKLGNANNGAYNNKYDIADIEDGGYFATKIRFTNDGSLSVILRTNEKNGQGNYKEIKYVVQNNNAQSKGDGSNFVFGLDDDGIANGIWDSGAFVSLAAYNEAFKGAGVWIVLGYDAATGELTSYIGTSLDSMRTLKTLQNITSGLTINGFGVGNWFSNISNTETASVTLKYGKTMADIGMTLEEKVTVTASVNDETMGSVALDATDGKYYSGAQVKVTVTANAGCYLQSIKVGEAEAITEGWTANGDVYTYTFNAPDGNVAVVATMAKTATVDSATITVTAADGFVTENAELTFECNGYTYTGTVENGTVTIGDTDTPVVLGTHKVYTVVNGLTINLGSVDVGDAGVATLTLNGETIFASAESAAAGYDLKELAITLDLKNSGNLYHNKLVTSVPESDTNYLFYKISLPDAMKTKLKDNTDKKLNISMPIVISGEEQATYKVVIQNGTVKYQFYGGAIQAATDNFWGTERTLDSEYWTALVNGDGFYLVVYLNKTDKKMSVYIGTALNELRLTEDSGSFSGDISSIGISMGNAVDAGSLDEGDQITVTVKYGKTMADIGMDTAAYCYSNITVTSETDLTGINVTLTDKDDSTKTYTVQMKKTDAGQYYIEGYFRAGNYNITVDGFTCTSAGRDENNQATTALWIDNVGGQCWGITLVAETATDEGDQTPAD